MKKSAPDFQRILIIATRQIGDVLCTTPLIRRARELWPNAVIDVLGYEKTMGMLVGNSDINEVIESPEHPKWPEYKQLIRRIFRQYDLAITTQSSDRAHIYGLLAAPKRVGIVPETPAHRWWKQWLSLYSVVANGNERHVISDRLELMVFFGGERLSAPVVPPPRQLFPKKLLKPLGRYIVMHATPMWQYKRWPAASWAILIEKIVNDGFGVVLTGSSSDSDRSLNAEITSLTSSSVQSKLLDASGILNLNELSELIAGAAAYVGVDTSVTHQAAALGGPVVALYGPTTPINFGPWPQEFAWQPGCHSAWRRIGQGQETSMRVQRVNNVCLLQGPGSCVPCMKAGCENHIRSHSDCLNQLRPEEVHQHLRSMLEQSNGHATLTIEP